MKILIVAFGVPSKKYGGGIGTLQSIKSIAQIGEVDYVGPEFDEKLGIPFNREYYLDYDTNQLIIGCSYLAGYPIRFYRSWKQTAKMLEDNKYDIVFTDYSKYDFITDWAHDNGAKSIVRVHNIETDYAMRASSKIKKPFRKLISKINYLSIKKRENNCLKKCDLSIFLSRRDLNRAKELFPDIHTEESKIVPVCVDKPKLEKNDDTYNLPRNYILATGSLWYGSNSEGIIWFIDNIWKDVADTVKEYSLVIAGSRPNSLLKKKCDCAERCILYENPVEMHYFFRNSSVYVAPIFDGAGMKVKIAEAYSYGLPVVATSHAFIGYETVDGMTYIADDKDSFICGLIEACQQTSSEGRYAVYNLFKERYSTEASIEMFKQIFADCIGYNK